MASFRKTTRADGEVIFQWRAKVPLRQEDGSITWRYVERSTGAGTLQAARERGKVLYNEFHAALDRPNVPKAHPLTFAEGAIAYMKAGGERQYLDRILAEIGTLPIIAIDQDQMHELAEKLYPGCKPSTINRQIYTPVMAIISMMAQQRRCPPALLRRPKGHDKVAPLKVPEEAWFNRVMPELSVKMRAVLLCLTLHGRRISEIIERVPADLDVERWTLHIPDSKTGVPILIPLAEPVIATIREMLAENRAEDQRQKLKGKPPRPAKWLFGTGDRNNFGRAIRAACEKAGVPSYGSHAIGRHSFATRLLRAGKSLVFVKDAGGWKTISMPASRYAHLEKSEVADEVRAIGQRWSDDRQRSAQIMPLKKTAG